MSFEFVVSFGLGTCAKRSRTVVADLLFSFADLPLGKLLDELRDAINEVTGLDAFRVAHLGQIIKANEQVNQNWCWWNDLIMLSIASLSLMRPSKASMMSYVSLWLLFQTTLCYSRAVSWWAGQTQSWGRMDGCLNVSLESYPLLHGLAYLLFEAIGGTIASYASWPWAQLCFRLRLHPT